MKSFPIIIDPGTSIHSHEVKTFQTLAKIDTVIVIKPVLIQGIKTPDIFWLGNNWEVKSPKGKGSNLLHNTLRRAAKQSCNIIIDLQRIQIHELTAIRTIQAQAPKFRNIKRIKVITRSHEVIDIKP